MLTLEETEELADIFAEEDTMSCGESHYRNIFTKCDFDNIDEDRMMAIKEAMLNLCI